MKQSLFALLLYSVQYSSAIASDMPDAGKKIPIHAVRPAAGIEKGSVIAYGHRISPPFNFEYREDRLYVNGIQLAPSLARQQKPIPDASATALGSSVDQFIADARKAYSEGKSSDEIIKLAKSKPGIVGAKIQSPTSVMLTLQHPLGPVNFLVSFPDVVRGKPVPPSSPTNKSLRANSADAKKNDLDSLKKALLQGRCVIFSSDGSRTLIPASGRTTTQVNKIMADQQMSRDEKVLRLRNVVFAGNSAAADDVINNYSSAEWAPDLH